MKVPKSRIPSSCSQGILQSRWTPLQINERLAEAQTDWIFAVCESVCVSVGVKIKGLWTDWNDDLPSKVTMGIRDATGIPICQSGWNGGPCFKAAQTLSQPASWDPAKSQVYSVMISMLQTCDWEFFKSFTLWSYEHGLSMHLRSQHTCNVTCSLCACVCVRVCWWAFTFREGFFFFFLAQKESPDCGEDPQSSTLEVITPGKAIRSIHFSSSKGLGRRQEVTSCFCCSNSQQPTAT